MREGGWANSNLRTQFIKILQRAGVAPWKRLFHSMRASRQTELERDYPLHVVCAWLGNTEAVAKKSYLLVTDADFQKAIQKPEPKEDEKSGTKSGTVNCESGTKSGTAGARTDSHQKEESLVNHRENSAFPANYEASQMEAGGIEPPSRDTSDPASTCLANCCLSCPTRSSSTAVRCASLEPF